MSAAAAHPTVHEVKHADLANNTFDGKKPDLYINTGTLGEKHFLFTVEKADGRPDPDRHPPLTRPLMAGRADFRAAGHDGSRDREGTISCRSKTSRPSAGLG